MQGEINVSNWSNNLQLFRNFADNVQNQDDDRIQLVQRKPGNISLAERRINIARGKEGLLTRMLFRSVDESVANDVMRTVFLKTVASLFGGVTALIPKEIRDAMQLDKFDYLGRPLTARRVRAVLAALDSYNGRIQQKAAEIHRDAHALHLSQKDSTKLSKLVAGLYDTMSPALLKNMDKLSQMPTIENLKSFLIAFNSSVKKNMTASSFSAGYTLINRPGDLELQEAKIMLLRFLMKEKPELRQALFQISANDYVLAQQQLEAEMPKDLAKRFEWAQNMGNCALLAEVVWPDANQIKQVFLKETDKCSLQQKLVWANDAMTPYWENLKAMIPEAHRKGVETLQDEITTKVSEMADSLQRNTLDNKEAYRILTECREQINDFEKTQLNVQVPENVPMQLRAIVDGIITGALMVPLGDGLINDILETHSNVLKFNGVEDAGFKQVLKNSISGLLAKSGVEFLDRVDLLLTECETKADRLNVRADIQEQHLALLKTIQKGNEAEARKLMNAIHRSFRMTAIMNCIDSYNYDNVTEAVERSITKFNTNLDNFTQAPLPANGLLVSVKTDKLQMFTQCVTDILKENYKRCNKLGKYQNENVNPVDIMKGNPFVPISLREYNPGDVLFNGRNIPRKPKNPNRYKNVIAEGGGMLERLCVANDFRVAFGEFLEDKFHDPKIRNFVSGVLSMSLGMQDAISGLLVPNGILSQEIEEQRREMLNACITLAEEVDNKYMVAPGGKNQKFDISIAPDGTISIRGTIRTNTNLTMLKNIQFPDAPVPLQEVEMEMTLVIPGGQDMANKDIPDFRIENVKQKING